MEFEFVAPHARLHGRSFMRTPAREIANTAKNTDLVSVFKQKW